MTPIAMANRIQILEVMRHSMLLSPAHDDPTFRSHHSILGSSRKLTKMAGRVPLSAHDLCQRCAPARLPTRAGTRRQEQLPRVSSHDSAPSLHAGHPKKIVNISSDLLGQFCTQKGSTEEFDSESASSLCRFRK